MRLDDFDPDINVEDQRGASGGGFGGGGGGLLFGLLPLIGSRFGCGGIVVVLLLFAVFGGGLGNIGGMLGGGGQAPTVQSGSRTAGTAGELPGSSTRCPYACSAACAVTTRAARTR